MYEEFSDIAEFRMVYITEAHAADGRRPVDYAKELNILEHREIGDRCETAERLFKDKSLTIPCVIDGMDNRVNQAYSAHPDRIFVVRSDGRLAVAGDRGPFGFEPAMHDARKWLEEFRKRETEPDLPENSAEAGEDRHVTPLPEQTEAEKAEAGKAATDKAKAAGDRKDPATEKTDGGDKRDAGDGDGGLNRSATGP